MSVPRRHNQTQAPQQTALAFDHLVRAEGHPTFAERDVMECLVGAAGHSGLMLAARITLLHFSVSLTMKVSKSAEEPANIALPRSERRACTWGSARIALISLLSLSTIAPGVLLRRAMAHHWLAS